MFKQNLGMLWVVGITLVLRKVYCYFGVKEVPCPGEASTAPFTLMGAAGASPRWRCRELGRHRARAVSHCQRTIDKVRILRR